MKNESVQCRRYCESTGRCLVKDIREGLFDDDDAIKLAEVFLGKSSKVFSKYVRLESARRDDIDDKLYEVESTTEGSEFLNDNLVSELNATLRSSEQRYTELDLYEFDEDDRGEKFIWSRSFKCRKEIMTPLVITSQARGADEIRTTAQVE